jgi:hypothetical protein
MIILWQEITLSVCKKDGAYDDGYHFRESFSDLVPEIWTEGDDLYVKTTFFQYVKSFFSHYRILRISKNRKIE